MTEKLKDVQRVANGDQYNESGIMLRDYWYYIW